MDYRNDTLSPTHGLSVVVPVYGGAKTLPALVDRLMSVIPKTVPAHEIILVDDGSSDGSWSVILDLCGEHTSVRGVRLMRNFGQHNATLCGVRAARYAFTVTMDQDLQHRPEDIPLLLAELERGFDVVYGAPLHAPRGIVRNVATVATKRILALAMQNPSVRNISAFRIFRTELREAFARFTSPAVTLDALLSWGSSRFSSVQVEIAPAASSNYSFFTLVKAALLILTGYSTAPLHLASWLGFFMTLFGASVFVYVVWVYLASGSLPGFPFLASIIALFSGTQMLVLGVLGEYLAQIFSRSLERPTYVIAEQVEFPT